MSVRIDFFVFGMTEILHLQLPRDAIMTTFFAANAFFQIWLQQGCLCPTQYT